eukprot:6213868-Lingulodinium_polyedra.AAC.1
MDRQLVTQMPSPALPRVPQLVGAVKLDEDVVPWEIARAVTFEEMVDVGMASAIGLSAGGSSAPPPPLVAIVVVGEAGK